MRLLVMGLLLYIGYRMIISLTATKNTPEKSAGNRDAGEETYRDPVCGLYISEEDAVVGKLDGQRHYFCSMACLEKFRGQLDHT
ncbi:MAG: transcriptional regulator [Proteobacteria bacterium]|nr:transcriptional regulator [Pseudomonadota bacterium]